MPVCGRFRRNPQAGPYRITESPDNRTFTKSRKEGNPLFSAFPYLIGIVVNQYDGIVTVSDCWTMLRYSLFAGPFGYGRDKTATRPRVRKHLIIIIPKNFLFKPIFYTRYIPFAFPFYLFSFLSLPATLPCRCDFPMRRYSVIRSSSTAPLTGSQMERQPSQIEDDLIKRHFFDDNIWINNCL